MGDYTPPAVPNAPTIGGPTVLNGGVTINGGEAVNGGSTIAGGLTTTGATKLAGAADGLGFYGHATTARTAAYTLTFATAGSRVLAADTAVDPAATAATNVTPFGYTTAAQADAVRAATVTLHADLDATKAVLKQLLADLQANGLLQ